MVECTILRLGFGVKFFGSLYFILLYFIQLGSPLAFLWIFLAILLSALIYLTSKFAIQAVLFGTILLTVLTSDWVLLLLPFLGLLVSIFLSGGFAWQLLQQQVKYLAWVADKKKKTIEAKLQHASEIVFLCCIVM